MPDHAVVSGLLGVHHIGFTVPDIGEAAAFFEDVLGAKTLARIGPIEADGAWMQSHLGVAAGARIAAMAVLRLANGANLELFEYTDDAQRRQPPANSDIGGHHVAFQVTDIAAATAALRAHGVAVMDGPTLIEEGDLQGLRWVYFRTPWGMFLELVEINGPLGHQARTGDALWSPTAKP